ncbi:MAG: ABC transporter ATP-binding protein [Pseudomonadota bacterium]
MEPGLSDVFRFAWRYWRRLPLLLTFASAGMLGATAVDVAMPLAIGGLIDALVDQATPDAAFDAFLAVLGLTILFHALHKGGDYVWCMVASRAMRAICAEAFAKVQRFSASWHADTFAGKTVRNITRATWAFDDFGDALYFGIVPAVLVTFGTGLVMAWKWPLMGVLFLSGAAFYVAVSLVLSTKLMAPRHRAFVGVDSELSGAIADAITNNMLVKTTAAEPREEQRLAGFLDRWNWHFVRTWNMSVHTQIGQAACMALVQGLMLGAAIWLWAEGEATPGDVVYVVTAFLFVNRYLAEIGQHIRTLERAAGDLYPVVSYRELVPEIVDGTKATPLVVDDAAIAFEAVRFGYGAGGRPLFDGLDVAIRGGEKIALVGHSGSGKSTFVKLLQRLHDIDGGAIRIDGWDIAQVTQASLRQAIALVPQEPVLFHRSLAENIAYAKPTAGAEEIERAARLANAHGFIAGLPDGYGTLVGERGVKLSGGERQRVAIARALLADRPILILDEATSSLDSESEQAIQEALERLMAGRTTLVIAHRLSTVRHVDRLLVFDQGRIVEEGTHDALLANEDGHYRRLHDIQAVAWTPGAGG